MGVQRVAGLVPLLVGDRRPDLGHPRTLAGDLQMLNLPPYCRGAVLPGRRIAGRRIAAGPPAAREPATGRR
jgi:hypothetical protein